MDEIKLLLAAVIVSFLIGAAATWFVVAGIKSSEIAEAQDNLRDATRISAELREENREYQERVGKLEELARERQEAIEELEEEAFDAIERARARDLIIARLESKVGKLSKENRRIGELASEGREIVKSLQEK